jgi:hypothetical protein
MDFFTAPAVTFKLLYCFFIISLDRRQILHVNVTPPLRRSADTVSPGPRCPNCTLLSRPSRGPISNIGRLRIPTLAVVLIVRASRTGVLRV